ncbi:glycosyltransferase family 4 protein [Cellulomonas sp. APG4]|uniref:glycosyltransferase family 4 protein n=1 Tax=Cellulomonas sp. APG4 TaxID=1538656 RepID=UPI001379F369|nr:glycosyltransferase family 4 protein [Cellulomonas sp. APG4]NCT91325.1 glycosyltransferase family 4 protein [Cellulomonas sp. APG4]
MGARGRARTALGAVVGPALDRRHLLPEPLDRAVDAVRWAGPVRHGLEDRALPSATRGDGALLVAPANFAGQGWEWARAYERATGRPAAAWMITADPVFAYQADHSTGLEVQRASRAWQRRQLERVLSTFDAVVLEAGRPLFGSLFGFDARREADALRSAGLDVAVLWHGTDIRLPSEHAATHPLSPYGTAPLLRRSRRLESVARRNRRRMRGFAGTVLVSTPDLLAAVPGSQWCPVVVDTESWASTAPVLERVRPVVVHVPSNPLLKGTDLVRPHLQRLHDAGVVEYREAAGLTSAEVRQLYREADVVLDQFRLGIYGVAACEAMAAGRVVLSSVDTSVRDEVHARTGHELPVVETPAAQLTDRLTELLADRDGARRRAAAGVGFVAAVHDGRRSAAELAALVGTGPTSAPPS